MPFIIKDRDEESRFAGVPDEVAIQGAPEEIRLGLGSFIVVVVRCGEIAGIGIIVGLGGGVVDTVETAGNGGGGLGEGHWR